MTWDLRTEPRNPFRQSREASKAQELPECLPGSLGPCPPPRAGASEQREKAASGDPSGPGARRWATTAVSSGNERGRVGVQAAPLVSVSASGQQYPAPASPFLVSCRSTKVRDKDWSPGTREVWAGFRALRRPLGRARAQAQSPGGLFGQVAASDKCPLAT